MSKGSGLSVGIVSDCPLQRHLMKTAITHAGYEVRYCREPDRFLQDTALPEEPDAWILMLKDEGRWAQVSDLFLENAESPILFADEEAPNRQGSEYDYWQRRLIRKLENLVGTPGHPPLLVDSPSEVQAAPAASGSKAVHLAMPEYLRPATADDKVEKVVLLVASLGGPAAVKAFIDRLPPQIPAGFIYAQHIDSSAAQVLVRVLGRHGNYPLHYAQNGEMLRHNRVLVVPIEQELCFNPAGQIKLLDRPWPGPYSPSINQIMLNVGDHFGARTLVIVFSGMGEDGAQAAPLLKAYGASIWCQNSESCANSSMVDAISATGCVDFRGTPEAMAEKLLKSMESETLIQRRNLSKGQ